ncbi:MAG: Beta-propeller repeat protein [Candidatus Methanofastidiosum methylothiophilum]|uniref:Beta-propeller repeat protein n=1 Tax=Candidatus Methanofastidiosum methylothiophilum TaxID=1705564 RepID=A0A150IJU4_9EURY|nr:MAG: Beta-propeller repeat protein [Candidatus Methanofastidiosum methylthiophilus]KYC48727.1 MAG: Beta-propeller repeat protein [Candidatus Methanofastidiosum methylthiophilus]KYC51375.1 MAG: Beta-propeller repeat protein [Candidatus Methanofastidiosum methylthiophilus]
MKKLTVILIAAMFIVSIAPAYCMGDVIWQREFNYGGNEAAYGVAVDTSNNVIVVGYGSNNTIVKYDSNGNKLRDQDVASNLLVTVATDSNNNIIVGGSGGISKFGPNLGTALWYDTPGSVQDIAVDSNNNIIVILSDKLYKYNPVGEFVWAPKDFTNLTGLSVAVDSNNNIIVAGYESSNNPLKVVKFDSNGNVLWAKTYDVDGVTDFAYGVAVDPNNNIIATGVSGDEILTIKYSSAGSQLWVKTYKEGTIDSVGHSVSTDSLGNIFVAGSFSTSSDDNWIVIKYDSNGTFGWKSVNPGISSGYGYDITTDSNNNVVAAGYGEQDSPSYTDFFYTVKYQAEPKKKSLPIEFILKILQKNKNK